MTLPSLYVFNTLVGSRLSLRSVVKLLVAALAVIMAVLASLGPIMAYFSAGTTGYAFMQSLYAAGFAVSGLLSLRFMVRIALRAAYRPWIERDPRHRAMARLWVVLHRFIGVQMGWVLRPFIGDPSGPVQFFRAGAWDNAYVVVWRMILECLGLAR